MNKPRSQPLTPEQQQVIDRMMQNAIRLWDAELIRRAAEAGAATQGLLVESIRKKDAAALRIALDYGASPEGFFPQGERNFQPVLHFAHAHFDEEVIGLLLARGVSVDQKNTLGETVAQQSARAGDFAKLRFYRERGADLSASLQELLFSAVRKKDAEILEWCLDQGADIEAVLKTASGQTQTVLHAAAENFDAGICDMLLRRGAAVDARASTGETPLMMAARSGDAEKIAYFLGKGADPLLTSHAGVSALDEATAVLEKALVAEKNVSSHRDYDRWSSPSPAMAQAKKEATAKARAALSLLLDCVKERHGVDPYEAVTQRKITVTKPIQKPGRAAPPEG